MHLKWESRSIGTHWIEEIPIGLSKKPHILWKEAISTFEVSTTRLFQQCVPSIFACMVLHNVSVVFALCNWHLDNLHVRHEWNVSSWTQDNLLCNWKADTQTLNFEALDFFNPVFKLHIWKSFETNSLTSTLPWITKSM